MSTIEFNRHFDQLQNHLFPFAYKLTNNPEDAKDLIQDTALRAFRHKDKFEIGTNFKAWLQTIMRNTFINGYRKNKSRQTHCEPPGSFIFNKKGNTIDNKAHSNIMMKEMSVLIDELDSTYRKPFMLYYQGYKYEEIAVNMSLPLGTVKSRIFFARRKLRHSIDSHYSYGINMN